MTDPIDRAGTASASVERRRHDGARVAVGLAVSKEHPNLGGPLDTEPSVLLFGDLQAVLSVDWETGQSGGGHGLVAPPDETLLFERLMGVIVVPTRRVGWCPQALGMGSSGGDDYFAADAELFEQEIGGLLLRLEKAFNLLRQSLSS